MRRRVNNLTANLGKQRGIASIIVVFIITILISLVSLGFARLMDRALKDVTNNQLGAAADYAAQSGLNDAISFVRTNASTTVTDCGGLTDPSKSSQDFVNYFSGKTELNSEGPTKYTCVLVDPVPGDLVYQNVKAYSSQMVKLQPDSGQLTEVTINWDANDAGSRNSVNRYPDFLNEQAWASGRPVLRVTLYPMSGSPTAVPGSSDYKTFYLYPNPGAGGNTFSFGTASGSVRQGNCTASQNSCAATINNLTAADYYIARLTPIYKAADITIKGKSGVDSVSFRDAQSAIDVTGRSNTAVRRIQARISTEGAITVNAGNDSIPEDAIRSAGTICKRLTVPDLSSPFNGYVLIDPTSDTNSPECKFFDVTVPAPTVDLKPDSKDITVGDTVTLTWTSTNATSCTGNWTGSTLPPNNNTGDVVTPSAPSQTYTITCTGPGGSNSDSSTFTVKPKPVAPDVTTEYVTGFGPPNATGLGTVNPNGFTITECYLEYGPVGSGYTSRSNCDVSPTNETVPVGVSAWMSSLASKGQYHFRFVATNAGGTTQGLDKCFTMNDVIIGSGGGMFCNAVPPPPPPPPPPPGGPPPPPPPPSGGSSSCPNPFGGGSGNQDTCIISFGNSGWVAYGVYRFIYVDDHASSCDINGQGVTADSGNGTPRYADISNVSVSGGTANMTCSGNGTSWASTGYEPYPSPPPPPVPPPPPPPPVPPPPPPPIGCFVAGSEVTTPDGLIPIEQLKVGDKVIGWDPANHKYFTAPITQTYFHHNEPTLWIVTASGSVQTTSIHPFWTGSGWVEAGDLIPGKSSIYSKNGKLEKVLVAMAGAKQDVYNLEVGNANHDYFVNGYLVHNKIMP